MRKTRFAAIALALIALAVVTVTVKASVLSLRSRQALDVQSSVAFAQVQAQTDSWPMYRRDPAHTGYSPTAGPESATLLWQYAVGDSDLLDTGVVAVADGKVFAVAEDAVYALNMETGEYVWSLEQGGESLVVADGKLFVGFRRHMATTGDILALNLNNGKPEWTSNIMGMIPGSLVAADSRLFISDERRNVIALDVGTGRVIWQQRIGQEVWSPLAVSDGKVFAFSSEFTLYALDAATGQQLWKRQLRPPWGGGVGPAYSNAPTVVDGKVFVGSPDGAVYAVDANSGHVLWTFERYKADEGASLMYRGNWCSGASVAKGKVFVSCGKTSPDVFALLALDAGSGRPIWETKAEGMFSSPIVAGDRVYAGSRGEAAVYAFAADTGRLIWKYKTEGANWSAPAVAGGKLFVRSLTKLYAFGAPVSYRAEKISHSIDLWAKIKVGESITVTGSIIPSGADIPVALTYRKPDGVAVTREVKTIATGTFTDVFKPDVDGQWHVAAGWVSIGPPRVQVSSPPIPFFVEPQAAPETGSALRIYSVTPTQVAVGKTVTVKGVAPSLRSGIPITLVYQRPDGASITRAVTTVEGQFTDNFQPDAVGEWRVTATGASETQPSVQVRSETVTFQVQLSTQMSPAEQPTGMPITTPPMIPQPICQLPLALGGIVVVACVLNRQRRLLRIGG